MDVQTILDRINKDYLTQPVNPYTFPPGRVKFVNLMPVKNAPKHHTRSFWLVNRLYTPIFRRGQEFTLSIVFNEPSARDDDVESDDDVEMHFSFGTDPNPDNGTMIRLRGSVSSDQDWSMKVISKGPECLFGVKPSPSCPVGMWFLTIVTNPGKQAFIVPQHMYILFNPWCIEDEVYMEKDNWRTEYVLNDQGIVFKSNQELVWNFNQFGFAPLMAALYLLEHMEPINRGSPKDVCKKICNLDGKYILEGRWDGHYKDGTSPMYWQSSVQILRKYMKTKERVKFGQCWCFAGIRTSLFRALGIPCRPSTIYCCGSDESRDGILEEIFREVKTPKIIDDKVWNFHVWNDVWMSRLDLSPEYGGWQAADQLMLASLAAVKRGEVDLEYGTINAFSDVNGVHVKTSLLEDGTKIVHKIDKHNIGNLIVTKAADAYRRQDITLEYKYREGSKEEKDALNKALTTKNSLQKLEEFERLLTGSKDVSFDVKVIPQNIAVGQSVNISVEGENHSDKDFTIKFHLIGNATDYRGYDSELVYDKSFEEYVGPYAPFKIARYWNPDQELLGDFGYVRISATAKVVGTKEPPMRREITINITTPKLEFDVPQDMRVKEKYQIYVKFTNPLSKELTDCSLHIEQSGTYDDQDDEKTTFLERTVAPNGNFEYLYQFSTEEAGSYAIAATFNSKELKDVRGTQRVQVV